MVTRSGQCTGVRNRAFLVISTPCRRALGATKAALSRAPQRAAILAFFSGVSWGHVSMSRRSLARAWKHPVGIGTPVFVVMVTTLLPASPLALVCPRPKRAWGTLPKWDRCPATPMRCATVLRVRNEPYGAALRFATPTPLDFPGCAPVMAKRYRATARAGVSPFSILSMAVSRFGTTSKRASPNTRRPLEPISGKLRRKHIRNDPCGHDVLLLGGSRGKVSACRSA
jgi:hypothetical protein